MVSDVERRAHSRVTEMWVTSDPVAIVLHRQEEVDDGAGGTKRGPKVELPPQMFRIDRAGNQRAMLRTSPEQSGVPMDFRLVGDIDADIQEGDWFMPEWGGTYHVVEVPRRTFERTVAEVNRRG